MRGRSGWSVVVVLIGALTVQHVNAQQADARATPKADATYQGTPWQRDACIGGLTYGAPLRLAVSYGGGIRRELSSGQDVCAFVLPQIGLGGARLNVGFAHTLGALGSAVGVTGGVLRTFGSPKSATPKSNYAGVSLHVLPILAIGLEVGWYRRLGGNTSLPKRNLIAWSAGFGF